jgi:DNA-binding protein YbaB
MEHDSIDLNDPITKKLDDNAALERLVRQAVAEAVDKARKLGFLDEKNMPTGQTQSGE